VHEVKALFHQTMHSEEHMSFAQFVEMCHKLQAFAEEQALKEVALDYEVNFADFRCAQLFSH